MAILTVAAFPSRLSRYTLIVNAEAIDVHRGAKTINSGFFSLVDADYNPENVSAVLWTNAGTIPKFLRMGVSGPYPDPDVSVIRYGEAFDPDPNAYAPQPFAYIVGAPDAPVETWGQEAVLFHNPHAKHPLPLGLFETVMEGRLENGVYTDHYKHGFQPISSISQILGGPGHRSFAQRQLKKARDELAMLYVARAADKDRASAQFQ